MIRTHGGRRLPEDEASSNGRGNVGTMPRRYEVTAESDLGQSIVEAATCPACQAELGLPCVDEDGRPLGVIHDARADVYDDGLLVAIEEMAGVAARATEERDQLVVRAVEAGISTRQVGAAAGMTHTAVQYIARRGS